MEKPIINLDETELEDIPKGFAATGETAKRFESKMSMIAQGLGAKKLGYNITCVPPGKRAFPFHNHRFNEEMFLILEGDGEIRIGERVFQIRQNDIISCPPGGKETAHQIINTGKIDLKYLAVSTKLSPDITEYPDSEKFGVIAEYPPDSEGKQQRFLFFGRDNESAGYWDGE